jgi:aminopeptidase
MTDPRLHNFAKVLVDNSARIQPGDRVLIESTTNAEALITEMFKLILDRGGRPYLQLAFPETREIFISHASEDTLRYTNPIRSLVYETFESRYRIEADADPGAMDNVDPKRLSTYLESESPVLETQFRRGAAKEFKWVTTLFPTEGYARQAGMSLSEYEDFVYKAVHATEADPVAYWNGIKDEQQRYADAFKGHDQVQLRGPNVDLNLSIKGRTFVNAFGDHNMPDGEIFTGPVEDSLNGWVRYTYPAMHYGTIVEGIELRFKDGKVVEAQAKKNEAYLKQILATDEGSSFVGEFAIGLNKDVDRFTGHILFDEKIGGSFHMAIGRGYPETGSQNVSAVHWDMICDLRMDSEITVDGELFYKDGAFVI